MPLSAGLWLAAGFAARVSVEVAPAQPLIGTGTVWLFANRVMSELGLASRAQAVVVAYESGLVTPGT
ncbi:hypothetical protein ACFYS8_04990 [Kitasatospora sp. NPDC004615]|uniref:hypothetical protein n=1 Tax=Kitasatospora sp. NPDC004615 TaxID=3364017 RepID=UPI0036C7182C